ncbi:MAG: dihydrofolate reductase, partial [Ignavibacteriaceae bacterium]
MLFIRFIITLALSITLLSCDQKKDDQNIMNKNEFKYQTEQFADLGILRYKVPGFNELNLKEKEFVYYLYEAALSGRDILYDQNFKHNLEIRKTLETIVKSYKGDRNTDDFKHFMVYTKRVWFSNGIHHHYSNQKFKPEFSKEYFIELAKNSDDKNLPLKKDESADEFLKRIIPVIFDPKIAPIKVNLAPGQDLIKTSAVNFYEGVNEKEVENFYNKLKIKDDPRPVWYGLNSKLIKANGKVEEKKWMVGGMYS